MVLQLFAEKVRQLWSGWEIRLLVVFSISLQIVLILFGSRRKHIAKGWVSILVWLAYLAADWVATVALGNLSTSQGESKDNSPNSNKELQAFWVPFLLMHLGGPDTITAYSLEDNELWLRHFLGLAVQVGVAFYVFILSWRNTVLTFLAIPIFIIGIIKFGERTLVLRSSSTEQFKDSLLSNLDPRPYFVRLTKQDIQKIRDEQLAINEKRSEDLNVNKEEHENESLNQLLRGSFLFTRFSRLFAGLILSDEELPISYNIFRKISAKDAFNLVAIELGFMYDVLYTKATIIYSRLGVFFRCICLISSISTLVIFSVVIHIHTYSWIDMSITYLLLVGAIVLEFYAFTLHFFSDWTRLCLIKFRNRNPNKCDTTRFANSLWANHKRWSGSMGQFNMISFCLDKCMPTICNRLQEIFHINKFLEKYLNLSSEDVTAHLQEMIFTELMKKVDKYERSSLFHDIELRKRLLAQRGNSVLEERYNLHNFGWLTIDIEFDFSLLVWHIY